MHEAKYIFVRERGRVLKVGPRTITPPVEIWTHLVAPFYVTLVALFV